MNISTQTGEGYENEERFATLALRTLYAPGSSALGFRPCAHPAGWGLKKKGPSIYLNLFPGPDNYNYQIKHIEYVKLYLFQDTLRQY